MYRKLIFAAVAASSVCLGSATASAMPNGLPKIEIENAVNVRWVCNPWGRCWWRPRFYGAYGFYGGPRFYGPRFYGPRFGGWRHRGWRHRW
jgi:hypothetical protein